MASFEKFKSTTVNRIGKLLQFSFSLNCTGSVIVPKGKTSLPLNPINALSRGWKCSLQISFD